LEAKKTEYRIAYATGDTIELRSIMGDIDPRIKSLDYLKQEEALLSWLQGHEIESYFKQVPRQEKGITTTYGPEHVFGYKTGDTIPGINSLNFD